MTIQLSHPIFKTISDCTDEMNVPIYVVGGWVRDMLLTRPCKDIDFVVIGSGTDVAEHIAKKLKTNVTVFKNFGTANIKYEGLEIEFVGARKESYRYDSRKPTVENGTLEDDQNRRDFTINALAVSLNKKNYGELLDPFGGIKDIEQKIIRTPLDPNITYSDDPLRMMRAIRFATQLNFDIEKKSLVAISQNKERIKIISKERIADEINKIILSPIPSVGFKLLSDTRLMQFIFPLMENLRGVETINGKSHKDNFFHTLQVLDNLSLNTDNLWLRWSALLHDIAKPQTKHFDEREGWTFHGHEDRGGKMIPKIFNSLKLPMNEKMRYVQKLVFLHLRPIILAKEEVTDSAIRRLLFEAGDDIDDLMLLCEADITTQNPNKLQRYLNNFELVRTKLKEVEEKDRIRNWQPPITGEIIMKVFNIPPSKTVGIIKDTIRDAILDGHIQNDYQEAYHFMIQKAKEMGILAVNKISF
ncbi:MAG: HD domain-containing protein [Bacteroidota bacterium]